MFDGSKRINVMQGTYETTADNGVVLSSVLGSCVAVCAHDPLTNVGGMNHILLPGEEASGGDMGRSMYGANLMELLLNSLYKRGALKSRLELKIFGGAKVIDSSTDAGTQNVAFIEKFVKTEGLNVVSSSIGGLSGRRLEFHPFSGKSRQKILTDMTAVKPEITGKTSCPDGGELELF